MLNNIPYKYSTLFVLNAYCDASFGSHMKQAQSGHLIFLKNVLISWKSCQQNTVKAECKSMHICIDDCIILMYFMYQLKFIVDTTISSDSLNLIKLLSSDYPRPKEKHMLIKLREMQNAISSNNEEVQKLVTPLLSLGDLFSF